MRNTAFKRLRVSQSRWGARKVLPVLSLTFFLSFTSCTIVHHHHFAFTAPTEHTIAVPGGDRARLIEDIADNGGDSDLPETGLGTRIQQTSADLDWLIYGDGYFRVEIYPGLLGYTRYGHFMTDAEGILRTEEGYKLLPRIQLPDACTRTTMRMDGRLTAYDAENLELADFQVTVFDIPNEKWLQPYAGRVFVANEGLTGKVIEQRLEGRGATTLRAGYLEGLTPVKNRRGHREMEVPVETSGDLNMFISGDGYFQIQWGKDMIAYTRCGSFGRDSEGNMVTSMGYMIEPQITFPEEAVRFSVSLDGRLMAYDGEGVEIAEYQVELARFPAAENLQRVSEHTFVANSLLTGAVIVGNPGDAGFGVIRSGFLAKMGGQ